MSVPTLPCPNCGTPWQSGASVCPHCGYLRPGVPTWPPPPGGPAASPLPPAPRLITGKNWGDLTLGISLSFLSDFLVGVGFIVMPILYFTLKRKYPVFARGLGYGMLAGIALVLGMVAVCFAALASYHGG